ncbi:tRNA threonylcarbamoyladenosine dehydratase [Comamonas serinivorans]|uniref:tRNA threonylcarbamoyladenosine dehydratase n=1 Tax=Comamonas serinivorans TaxID=1082851 RepID=A0A1Y0ETM5_9BURK|nr:tRNA threonylcarbamoyladenosine dehydratase [Comamonas serinivorans]ARU06760.1 tRNA threonylcarbamoyladenosine dehydratase [Comamonas serinivorans]
MNSEPHDLDRRFGGLERLYGVEAARAIRAAHVGVVGIGGVGSWVAEALARSGVGRLSLVDLDHVAESNINRQVHANTETLGQSKVEAMAARIAGIHPGCQVQAIDEFVEADTWPMLEPLLSGLDVLIDACDSQAAKRLMAHWSRRSKVRLVVCGAAGGKRQAQLVEVGDLAQVTHDPLLAKLRYQLRKDGFARTGKMQLPCVFSREPVAPPHASCAIEGDGSLNCHGFGSSVTVTASFGMVAASWALDVLARAART